MADYAQKHKILIVDDIPENIEVLGEVLKPFVKLITRRAVAWMNLGRRSEGLEACPCIQIKDNPLDAGSDLELAVP